MILKKDKKDGDTLQYIRDQTKSICLKAICLEAIKQNSDSIEFVDIEKFPEIWDRYVLENV